MMAFAIESLSAKGGTLPLTENLALSDVEDLAPGQDIETV
jgi:hypothetical protein